MFSIQGADDVADGRADRDLNEMGGTPRILSGDRVVRFDRDVKSVFAQRPDHALGERGRRTRATALH
jgi:hypothetical protein